MTTDDYAPGFPLTWALKDVDLVLPSSPQPLPVMFAIAEQRHQAVSDPGGWT